VTPPSQLRPDLPRDLEAVILRCLAKNPNDRYPDTPSLARALEGCADASNWSPAHAAHWWQANASLYPGAIPPPPLPERVAITEECPGPTEVLEPAEVPRFT
jgi:eukaryotic-like serine/threonine-protein kinase